MQIIVLLQIKKGLNLANQINIHYEKLVIMYILNSSITKGILNDK